MASMGSVSDLDVSSPETQFMPREGDEEALWKVIEITAENKKAYKVRWEGIDPATGKPWAQSWVPKHDCTDDLVAAWKISCAKKKRSAGKKKVSSKSNTASSSSTARRRGKSSVSLSMSTPPRSIHVPDPLPADPPRSKRGRTDEHSSDDPLAIRRHKKAKLVQEVPSEEPVVLLPRKNLAVPTTINESNEEWDEDRSSSPPKAPERVTRASKQKKRQPDDVIDDARSSRSSTSKSTSAATTVKSRITTYSKRPLLPAKSTSSIPVKPKAKPLARKRKAYTDVHSSSEESEPLMAKKTLVSKRHTDHTLGTNNESEDDIAESLSPRKAAKALFPPRATRSNSRLAAENTPASDEPQNEYDNYADNDFIDDNDASNNQADDAVPEAPYRTPSPPPIREKPKPRPMSGAQVKKNRQQAPNDSYLTGIVPETETESSANTQSQSHPGAPFTSPPKPNTIGSPPATPPRNQSQSVPVSPQRVSVKSRMKPRTPSSSGLSPTHKPSTPQSTNSATYGSSKRLGPIPYVSPSTFRPHLQSSLAPPSTSHIESDMETEERMYDPSPIEHFSSPEKDDRPRRSEERDDVENYTMVRGQELADRSRQRKLLEKGKKRTMSDVVKAHKERQKDDWLGEVSAGVAGLAPATTDRQPFVSSATESDAGGLLDAFGGSLIQDVTFPDTGENAEVLGAVQEMENAYVDLNGGDDEEPAQDQQNGPPAHLDLRQEEEESTQDIMNEMMRANVCEPGVAVEGRAESIPAQMEGIEGDSMSQEVPLPIVPVNQEKSINESRSRSASLVSQRDPTESPQAEPMPLNEDVVSSTQSESISTLEKALESERARADALATKVDELQNALALASEPTEVALLKQQLGELRESAEADEVAWEAERSALTSSLETQQRAKASAEEDRDFFKEQYAQASGFVTSVRAENDELAQQAQIADKRSVDGVRLVRETFSERVKVLEAELKKYKNLSTLLMEKDRRTGDAIRRRAGEEPQLRLRCMELEEQVEKLTVANQELETDLIVLQAEKTSWDAEKMLADMEGLENGTDAVSSMVEGHDDDDSEMVHRCQWRTDEKTTCEGLFLNIEELRNHIFVGGHLQEP